MPSKTPAQAKLMRAAAHGWKMPGGGGPSPAVAREFVAADQAVGMYEGGLAPMVDIIQRMDAPGLNFQEGGEVEGLTMDQLKEQFGGGFGGFFGAARAIQNGEYFANPDGTYYKAEPTILQADESGALPAVTNQGPRGGRGPRGGGGGGRGNRGGGGGGRGGGGGGGGPGPTPDDTCPSGFRRRGGQCVPVSEDDPPRIIPPTTPPVDLTPPDRRAGRDTEYSAALRAHKERMAATLGVPPGGFAEGGEVNRPSHAEDATAGRNPYPHGSARYNMWERKNHVDPPPPPPPPPPEEEQGWLSKLLGLGAEEDRQSKTEEYLEEQGEGMEEAHGGYIDGYAYGGLAQANFGRPPMGGMPPQMGGGMRPRRGGVPPSVKPQMDPRSMPPNMAPPPGKDPRMMPPNVSGGGGGIRGMMNQIQGQRGDPRSMPPQGGGRAGMMRDLASRARGQMPPGGGDPRMPTQPWRGAPPPRMRPPPGVDPRGGPGVVPGGGGGPTGGPMVPPNLRGHMQRARMMNRPRRGVPGPAGAGGPPNRVGMQDQQGGLARALQKGTGRPPMSRRSGFPGR